LTAAEALFTPLLFYERRSRDPRLPPPSLDCLAEFAGFCGVSRETVRVTLHRLRKSGTVVEILEEPKRYRLTDPAMLRHVAGMSAGMAGAMAHPGYTIAAYAFPAAESAARQRWRDQLERIGFTQLAHGLFINARTDHDWMWRLARDHRASDSLYLFDVPSIEDPVMVERLLAQWDIAARTATLEEFWGHFMTFLAQAPADGRQHYLHLNAASAVLFSHVLPAEPPYPPQALPPEYPLWRTMGFLGAQATAHEEAMMAHYLMINQISRSTGKETNDD
jgi:DNA-binding transcriptional regulator PaaX